MRALVERAHQIDARLHAEHESAPTDLTGCHLMNARGKTTLHASILPRRTMFGAPKGYGLMATILPSFRT